MYEYLAELERWKKLDNDYNEKYQKIINFSENCIYKCKTVKSFTSEIDACISLCKKPIVDIERHNLEINKRITLDIYELCSNKLVDANDLSYKITKIKVCSENILRDNEIILKTEILNRIDNILSFLNV